MKKLWALEDNRAQPKDNFASCEITKVNLRNQGPTCEMDNSTCEIHLCTPRYLRPTLLDFFFRYFMFKSIFSPCNPPIIGFLSQGVRRRGEQPFYIIYCKFLLKYLSQVFLRDQFCIVWEESNTQSFALPYLLILIIFLSLAKQTLRIFSHRMSGQAFCFLE